MGTWYNIDHWATHSYGWYLNQNGAGDGLSFNDVEDIAILSHNAWTSSSISTTDLTINYLGSTSSTWGEDGISTVFWAEDGDPAFEYPNPLYGIYPGGITCIKVNYNNEIIEADVIMNGKKDWLIAGSDYDTHDIRGCLTHETGHTIGLGHPSSMTTPAQTMWVYVAYPDDPRDLEEDDIVGVSFLYGGKITDDRSLSGSLYFNWPISVVSGKTLTLSSGANLLFSNGASLTVNGTLNAVGTGANKITFDRSGSSGTWGGLVFNSGSSGTVNNAIIRNGYYGVSVTGNPTGTINISNSTITSSTYDVYITGNTSSNINVTSCDIGTSSGGIVVNSGVANIDGCTIHNITTYGGSAVIFNNSGGAIKNSIIQNNSGATNGISISNNSSPYIFNNNISNNTLNGVYVYQASPSLQSNTISTTGYGHAAVSNNYYSYTLFGKTSYPFDGYNTISNSYYGIYADAHSIIQAGYTDIARYNRILDNSVYNTYVSGSSTLYAKNAWWGTNPPNTTKFHTDAGSYFYYLPYLYEDPSGQQNIASIRTPILESNVASSATAYSPEEELLLKANDLKEKHQTNEAIAIYKELIKTYEENSVAEIALVELSNIYRQTKEQSEKDYLGNFKLQKNNKKRLYPIALEILSLINKEEGNVTEALADCETLLKEFPSTEHEKNALMNKFFLYYDANDFSSAKIVIEKLTNSYSEFPEVAMAVDILGKQDAGKQYSLPKANTDGNAKKDTLVEHYEINNYPNPFNPVTTISYQLPKDGFVTLKIYDILGNEVKTLVNEQREKGSYTVQFDASTLASGIYVYQIKANDFVATKKMLLLK